MASPTAPSSVHPRGTAEAAADTPFVSTGHLPVPEHVRELLYAAHERFADIDEGENANVYPVLETVPRDLFGIAVVATEGAMYDVGDAAFPFSIMSVSKPFVFALVCQALGAQEVRDKLGVNSTGLPFNSVMAIELNPERLTNPMVNSGALADHQSCSRRHGRGEVAIHSCGTVALCWTNARAQRRGLRLGVNHEPPQPGYRPPLAEL